MKTSQPDYYAILGVTRNASQEDIKRRYRELARQYHPDRHNDNPLAGLAEEKLKLINEAWEVLGDPERRRQYDESGVNGSSADRDGVTPYDITLSRIAELCDQRLWSQAMAMCEEAAVEYGHAWEIYFWESVIHVNIGQYPRAAQLLKWCIERGADNGTVHNHLGVALLHLERPGEAVQSFRRAIKLDGEIPLYIANLAIAYENAGDRASAESQWAHLAQVDPQNEALAMRQQARQQLTAQTAFNAAALCGLLECIFDCI